MNPKLPDYWPTQGWRESTPEEQGFDSVRLVESLQVIQDQNLAVDSLLVIRNGAALLDAYFYPFDGTAVHNLASVTKSVMTTLIGIAAGQGKLCLDQPVLSFFPGRTIANLDERKERIKVRHLAGMVNGLESGCQAGDRPTIAAMMAQPDWVQAALDRKMVQEPGTSFCYDSPGMHLLSAILQAATGLTALEFAQRNLFQPLGIQDVAWEADPQGYTHGWSNLRLKPRDAAKIGYLFLRQGVWEGRQIVPADWVAQATKPLTPTGRDEDYAYGWWVSKDAFKAIGRGGQRIIVVPSLDLIVVTTGGGFEFDSIEPFLAAALGNTEKPLEANPQAVDRLKTTLAGLAQAPEPQPIWPLPDTAPAISSKTYLFGPNPARVETLSLEFSDPAEAILRFTNPGGSKVTAWPIGLDGIYRRSHDGQAHRGRWLDLRTFTFESVDIETRTYQLYFVGDDIVLESPELELRIEGKQVNTSLIKEIK